MGACFDAVNSCLKERLQARGILTAPLCPAHSCSLQTPEQGGKGEAIRGVNNILMELRNICNHPLIRQGLEAQQDTHMHSDTPFPLQVTSAGFSSQPAQKQTPLRPLPLAPPRRCRSRLHPEGAELLLPAHSLPAEVRLCAKLELLDRVLPKLKAGGHKVSGWVRGHGRGGYTGGSVGRCAAPSWAAGTSAAADSSPCLTCPKPQVLLFCTMTRALDVIEVRYRLWWSRRWSATLSLRAEADAFLTFAAPSPHPPIPHLPPSCTGLPGLARLFPPAPGRLHLGRGARRPHRSLQRPGCAYLEGCWGGGTDAHASA